MPSWFVPLICLVALVAFIWFAFRQGTTVTPDRNNTNTGPSQNDYPPGTMIDRASMPIYLDKQASSERGGISQTCQEKASQSFDRDESTMFGVPKSDTRCRRTLFIHGYEEPYFVK
jgi:hypothetical protein